MLGKVFNLPTYPPSSNLNLAEVSVTVATVSLCASLQQAQRDEMKAGDAAAAAGEKGECEIEIPREHRMTTGLRMKRRAVTTQEAAVEDDRSAGLQIGTVGGRGQLMNTHSKNASEQWRCKFGSPGTWDLQVASFISFKAGNGDSQEC